MKKTIPFSFPGNQDSTIPGMEDFCNQMHRIRGPPIFFENQKIPSRTERSAEQIVTKRRRKKPITPPENKVPKLLRSRHQQEYIVAAQTSNFQPSNTI